MSITIRPVREEDFFAWLELYAGYAAFYDTELTDEKALLLWSWLINPAHEESGFVAVDNDDDDRLVGLAHVREFTRPLETDRALYLDDLYVAEDHRGSGIGRQLLDFVRDLAKERNLGIVQWITASDNEDAQRLYDAVAGKTSWVTYEMTV
jgi:GNAT superfamily N-acetyltransferase